ncbi:MAG: hypothetical protein HKN47_03650 [Pirellulaceae bacterium]|nr:hypothetical protein [Pirellulaceae bacterium]
MRSLLSILLATVFISSGFVSSVALADPPKDKSSAQEAKTRQAKTKKTDDATDQEMAKRPMSFWMEKKLDHTQSILRGLATRDFESIKEHGIQMRLLNKVEGFVRRRNPNYRSQLHTFERVCDDIVSHADRENLAGVTLAFNQLTVSCVSCHETLRANDEEHIPLKVKPKDAKKK